MKVTLLLTNNHRPLSVAAILDVFQTVNSFYEAEGKDKFFEFSLAGIEYHMPVNGYKVVSLSSVSPQDLVLVPAFDSGSLAAYIESNLAVIPWLQQQHLQKAEIASFCTGAYLLAVSGLLNGRKATTHVLALEEFKKNFPEVILEEHKVVTDDNGVYTSGGATSSFHLMLYLIEKFCGREVAVKTAKFFAIDMDRNVQSYFSSFFPGRQHDDKIVALAQERMVKDYARISTVEEFIKDLPVSRRNFIRRFKGATGVTTIEYLQNIRIEAAKRLLENTQNSVTAIMWEVGYSDVKAFRNLFKRITGLSPSAYQIKYRSKVY